MATTQSQGLHGPYVLSFGDVHLQIIRCKRHLGLTEREYEVLHAIIQAIDRPRYRSRLEITLTEDASYWIEMTGLARQNINLAFRGLEKKSVITIDTVKGKSSIYRLTNEFIFKLASRSFSAHYLIPRQTVNKQTDCHQSDDGTVIKSMTPCNQIDDGTVIKSMTPCNQIDDAHTYIDSPSIPNLPSLSRSISLVQKPVDKNGLIKRTAEVVAYKYSRDRELVEKAVSQIPDEKIGVYEKFLLSRRPYSQKIQGFKEWTRAWATYLLGAEYQEPIITAQNRNLEAL